MSSFFTDKIHNHEGAEIIAKISFEDVKIEIFGEEHNTPLPTNHVYKELIDHEEFQDAIVMHDAVFQRLLSVPHGDDGPVRGESVFLSRSVAGPGARRRLFHR